jgi:hypothetical protein
MQKSFALGFKLENSVKRDHVGNDTVQSLHKQDNKIVPKKTIKLLDGPPCSKRPKVESVITVRDTETKRHDSMSQKNVLELLQCAPSGNIPFIHCCLILHNIVLRFVIHMALSMHSWSFMVLIFEPFLIGALLFWQYNVVTMLQLELGQNSRVAVQCSIELNVHYFFLLSKHCFYIPVPSLFGASLVFKFFTQIDL